MARLIPELICSDLGSSLAFYRLLGFAVSYSRPGARFAYLTRKGADLMLDQTATRDRIYPRAELARPTAGESSCPSTTRRSTPQ